MNEISTVAAGMGGQFHGSLLNMILDAGLMVQLVLILLFVFSIVSWAIIFLKYRTIRKVRQENELFLDAYMRSSKLAEIFPEAKKYATSTLAAVFRAGYGELVKLTKARRELAGGREEEGGLASLELRGIDNVERALNRAASEESSKLEMALGFLATTGSASPFIGLFGTVWGLMDTFK